MNTFPKKPNFLLLVSTVLMVFLGCGGDRTPMDSGTRQIETFKSKINVKVSLVEFYELSEEQMVSSYFCFSNGLFIQKDKADYLFATMHFEDEEFNIGGFIQSDEEIGVRTIYDNFSVQPDPTIIGGLTAIDTFNVDHLSIEIFGEENESRSNQIHLIEDPDMVAQQDKCGLDPDSQLSKKRARWIIPIDQCGEFYLQRIETKEVRLLTKGPCDLLEG